MFSIKLYFLKLLERGHNSFDKYYPPPKLFPIEGTKRAIVLPGGGP